VPDVLVDEPVDAGAGVAAGAGAAAVEEVAAADSFFSPVLVPPVSPPALDGGLSLSE